MKNCKAGDDCQNKAEWRMMGLLACQEHYQMMCDKIRARAANQPQAYVEAGIKKTSKRLP